MTLGALLRFSRETGHDISEMPSESVSELITLFWCCVVSACKADGITFEYPLLEFADMISADVLQEFATGLAAEDPHEKKSLLAQKQ
jgi:hypothetical protein